VASAFTEKSTLRGRPILEDASPAAYSACRRGAPGRLNRFARLIWFAAPREETGMAYGVVHQFAGGTEDQYAASIAAVHPSDGSLPSGQTFHAAGPSADGWMIVAIHDSKESWEAFRDGTLMPRMQQGIDGGFTAPPKETTFEVRSHQS
jgi:hypothetical protein